MSWALLVSNASGLKPQLYPLRKDSIAYIVLNKSEGSVGLVHELPDPSVYAHLGQITVGIWGAKLEAIDYPLKISSGQKHANVLSTAKDARAEMYQLDSRADGRSEIMLLRPGDVISSSKATTAITCTWKPTSEVQVNSSAVEAGVKARASETAEETEDEESDNALTAVKATQSKSQQPRPTPQLSEQRSVVIQETPTAARFNGVADYPAFTDIQNGHTERLEVTPTPEIANQLGAESYSTARTGQSQSRTAISSGENDSHGLQQHEEQEEEAAMPVPPTLSTDGLSVETPQRKNHPRVMITKKRPTPAMDEEEADSEITNHSSKRAKVSVPSDNDTQDSRLSNIVVDYSPATVSAKKGKKRKSVAKDAENIEEATPLRSQRSSQRSASAASAEPYSGDTPCIATSNSTLSDKSQGVKFLKKQGGSLVDSVKDPFNILCVRDGDLYKTPKVLQAIATGTPIVIDKWLTDSAKAGHFLSVNAYRPSAPKQEKEWDFKLEDIIGQPQTPFKGYILHFTSSAYAMYKAFSEIEQVCKAAGADKVTKKKVDKGDNVIVLAAEEGDKEAAKLAQDGARCYYRGILPKSIFKGNFELDSDEFKVDAVEVAAANTEKETKTKRGRRG